MPAVAGGAEPAGRRGPGIAFPTGAAHTRCVRSSQGEQREQAREAVQGAAHLGPERGHGDRDGERNGGGSAGRFGDGGRGGGVRFEYRNGYKRQDRSRPGGDELSR